MELKITDADIAAGKPKDANACPAALALQRQSGNSKAHVGFQTASSGVALWFTPLALQAWIHKFDKGQPVSPMIFILGKERPV